MNDAEIIDQAAAAAPPGAAAGFASIAHFSPCGHQPHDASAVGLVTHGLYRLRGTIRYPKAA